MITGALDLSHWNETVNMDEIRESGIVGVIHKATEDTGYRDPDYDDRENQALIAGLKWGAYHFMRPGDMLAQAEHFITTVGVSVHRLYCADYEDPEIPLDDLKVFLAEIWRLTGRPPVLYSGHVLKEKLDGPDPELGEYPLWIAHYTSDEQPDWPEETWPTWWLWQYSEEGTCEGVEGDVDVNAYDGSPKTLALEWSGWRRLPRIRAIV